MGAAHTPAKEAIHHKVHGEDAWKLNPLHGKVSSELIAKKRLHSIDGHVGAQPLPFIVPMDKEAKVQIGSLITRPTECHVSKANLARFSLQGRVRRRGSIIGFTVLEQLVLVRFCHIELSLDITVGLHKTHPLFEIGLAPQGRPVRQVRARHCGAEIQRTVET
ncbi:hypothetical protein VDGD_20653 [Verticillium dahliae]|nr:hypothetical protein VDGD_20653 [Verticillium dahliae]